MKENVLQYIAPGVRIYLRGEDFLVSKREQNHDDYSSIFTHK